MLKKLLQTTAQADENASLKKLYASMDADEFKEFVKENFGTVLGWPEEVREDIKAKWNELIPNESCPLES